MKHTFTRNAFAAILFTLFSGTAFGQCVIDTNNFALFSPPSEELPCVVRNTAYDLTLQLFCPPSLGGITIDSIKVSTFPGMPTGLTKTSYPASGVMHALGRMCISITGTTTDTVGYYEILYNGTAYLGGNSVPFTYIRNNYPGTIPDYALTVIDSGAFCSNTDTVNTGIKNLNAAHAAFSVYPNPTSGVFTFALSMEQKGNGEITVTDITGRTVYSQLTQATPFYQTEIDLSPFAKGIYFVRYRTKEGTAAEKITKQ